jgi:hypothetical protein
MDDPINAMAHIQPRILAALADVVLRNASLGVFPDTTVD